jgi:hypothetical protein
MNSSDLNEIRLLNKKDFLIDIIKPQYKEKYKNWKIKDLREYFELTHKKHGKYVNYFGYCFKCFTPLRADYTKFENYCQDC